MFAQRLEMFILFTQSPISLLVVIGCEIRNLQPFPETVSYYLLLILLSNTKQCGQEHSKNLQLGKVVSVHRKILTTTVPPK